MQTQVQREAKNGGEKISLTIDFILFIKYLFTNAISFLWKINASKAIIAIIMYLTILYLYNKIQKVMAIKTIIEYINMLLSGKMDFEISFSLR